MDMFEGTGMDKGGKRALLPKTAHQGADRLPESAREREWSPRPPSWKTAAFEFLLLLGFWFLLSGRMKPLYVGLGVAAAALVTFLSSNLSYVMAPKRTHRRAPSPFTTAGRVISYFAWLLSEIVQSNLQVAYLVLHPRMPIQPGLLEFKTRLRHPLGHVLLANSITLTPGTLTVDFRGGHYLVHALRPDAANSLVEEKMQHKIEAMFGEPIEPPPYIRWVHQKEEHQG